MNELLTRSIMTSGGLITEKFSARFKSEKSQKVVKKHKRTHGHTDKHTSQNLIGLLNVL